MWPLMTSDGHTFIYLLRLHKLKNHIFFLSKSVNKQYARKKKAKTSESQSHGVFLVR